MRTVVQQILLKKCNTMQNQEKTQILFNPANLLIRYFVLSRCKRSSDVIVVGSPKNWSRIGRCWFRVCSLFYFELDRTDYIELSEDSHFFADQTFRSKLVTEKELLEITNADLKTLNQRLQTELVKIFLFS